MAAARWLLVAGLAALVGAEFPDLTLVLQPDEDLDWNQITRWMEQSRFSVDAGSQHHALPQTPTKAHPGAELASAAGRDAEKPMGAAAVVSGPPLVPPTTVPAVPGKPTAAVPGTALVPSASPIATRSVLRPSLPTFRPTWRPLRPGPALLPGASPPSPLAKWTPRWPKLRPGPPLVPRPPLPLVSEGKAVLRPTFSDLQRDEPLLPADAPGAYKVEPFNEPASQTPTAVPAAAGPVVDPPSAGGPPAASPGGADFSDLAPAAGLLPPDERERYQPPEIDDYDQQSPPAQLSLAARPPPPPPPPPAGRETQQHGSLHRQPAVPPADGTSRRSPSAIRSLPGHTDPPNRSVPSAQSNAGHQSQHTQQPVQQPGGFPERQAQQPGVYREGASSSATGTHPGLEERSGTRLLAQTTPAAMTEQPSAAPAGEAAGIDGQLPPDALAVLLQRLEERLVASEAQQQQHTTQLRAIQHSQRRAEVVAREDIAAIRSEFRDLDTKMDNLQSDLGRVATVQEAVMTGVQGTRRTLREQAALLSRGDAAAEQQPEQLERSVAELSKKLGQLVVNTELLKGGQRRLGGNVRAIENRTSELSERSEGFATKVALAGSLSEMRTYLDTQKRAPVAPAPKEDQVLPKDCSDVLLSGEAGRKSGIYQVWPRGAPQPIFVYCDQETDGGGWAVIQRRTNGDEDFYRDWISYKYGFGNLAGEFWLGNENIHLLTNHRLNELRVDLADFPRERPGFDDYPGSNATARYGAFALGSETEGYPLKVLDHYSGDAGDSLKYHAGMKFSTKDVDNDLWKEDSCAASHKGGWWYKGCDSSNLNGLYLSGPVPSEFEYQVAYWYDWRGPLYSLYQTKMMVRPTEHAQRTATGRRRGSSRAVEDGKTAAQRRLGTQMVRGRGRRRRQRRRKGRRHGL